MIEYAIEHGWRFEKSGPRAHSYGKLYCPESSREGHIVEVYSTPKTPFLHAKRVRQSVDACPHWSRS
ncbi:hypothetical protein [Lacunimicrobium album]